MSGNSPGELGDILLQCQRDLQTVRSRIDELPAQNGGHHEAIYNSLRSVLVRAETNLQDKASYVLRQATFSPLASLNSLPAASERSLPDSASSSDQKGLQETKQQLSSTTDHSAHADHRTNTRGDKDQSKALVTSHANVIDRLREKKSLQLSLKPSQTGAREYLSKRYGLCKARKSRHRAVGRHSGSSVVRKGAATAVPKILPKLNRKNPQAPLPMLSREDLKEGLYNLVNRGAIPKDAEISEVAQQGTMRARGAVFHDFHRQFDRSTIATIHDLDLANVRFDYSGAIKEAKEEMKRLPPPPQEQKERIITSTVVVPVPQEKTAKVEEDPRRDSLDDRDQTVRDYDELLDQYSLHQFIIRKGKVLDTPEFVSFKRKYSELWGPISSILQLLENVVSELGFEMVLANGQRLAELAQNEMITPNRKQLLNCLGDMDSNPLQISDSLKGKNKLQRAAIKIQAFARMWMMRKNFKVYQFRHSMAQKIQMSWRMYALLQKTRQRISANWEKRLIAWRSKMVRFRENWGKTCRKRRIEIHIPSISVQEHRRRSFHNFSVLENAQMARFCVLRDPKVEVIYIAPFRIPQEILGYFYALLEVGGIQNPERRIKIILPENLKVFPEHYSLTRMALYSPTLLKTVKRLVKGRPAYLVPGALGQEDIQLAVELDVPMLSAEPDVSSLCGSKSGARAIFVESKVPVAVGASSIFDEKDFFRYFSKLIVGNIDVRRWIFKIDHECGGRGIAYLDLSSIQVYRSILKERNGNLERWNSREVRSGAEIRIVIALKGEIGHKVKIAHPNLYPNWDAFKQDFFREGGVIEAAPNNVVASPSCNVYIEPDGTVQVTSTHDQIFMREYVYFGNTFPSAGPHEALYKASCAIGKKLYQEGVIGYVGIDFVLSHDKQKDMHSLIAVDLNLRITASCVTYMLFNCLTGGRFYPSFGEYFMQAEASSESSKSESTDAENRKKAIDGPKRFYTAINYLYESQISTLQFNTFFNACRLRNVSYDIHSRQGTVFIMIDSLASGAVGILSIGRDLLSEVAVETKGKVPGRDALEEVCAIEPGIVDSLRLTVDALDFIREQSQQVRFSTHLFNTESTLDPVLVSCRLLLKSKQRELEAAKKKIRSQRLSKRGSESR